MGRAWQQTKKKPREQYFNNSFQPNEELLGNDGSCFDTFSQLG